MIMLSFSLCAVLADSDRMAELTSGSNPTVGGH